MNLDDRKHVLLGFILGLLMIAVIIAGFMIFTV